MAKADLILTEEQAVQYALTLKAPIDSIARAAEINRIHGDMAASLFRVSALQQLRKAMQVDQIKALIIAAAGDGYEVAESEKFKIPDDIKLEGAIRAMQKGYLLSDEAGPHFTVILGKGGVSVLIKEAGHRHKLRRAGAKNIDVVAAARQMRPRPNASGKFDMIVDGMASCEVNGELFQVMRKGDLPMILPCYDTDGPDGHEAKARRRLLRDLWAKVSGEFEPIEIDEADADYSESSGVVVVDAARIESQPELTELQRDRKAAESDLQRARDMVNADELHLKFVNRSIDGINESQSLEMLKAVGGIMKEDSASLKVGERVLAILRRLYQVRERELQGAT
jgi:hypothetical protein